MGECWKDFENRLQLKKMWIHRGVQTAKDKVTSKMCTIYIYKCLMFVFFKLFLPCLRSFVNQSCLPWIHVDSKTRVNQPKGCFKHPLFLRQIHWTFFIGRSDSWWMAIISAQMLEPCHLSFPLRVGVRQMRFIYYKNHIHIPCLATFAPSMHMTCGTASSSTWVRRTNDWQVDTGHKEIQ